MTGTTETLATLPPLQRRMAEAWISRFEESWHDQKLKECMRALPPQSSLRKPLLLAMIERDLAHNWKSGRPVSLTDYLKEFPELGTPDDIPIELIAAEYTVRQEHGRADLADFAERYPTRIDDLYVLLKPSLFDAPIPEKNELKKSVEDSVTAKRMKLLRSQADSQESDPVSERRRQLLRGDSAELPPTAVPSTTPPPADSFADIPGLQPTDSVEMFLPPEPPRSQPTRKLDVSPAETVWLDVEKINDPNHRTQAPSKNERQPQPAPPPVFGRYHIEKRLGSSGFGTVFEATDTQLDRRVALKIPIFPADDPESAKTRFHREARAAATLWHPLLCPVLEVGEIDGWHYLVMPFVEGEPLNQVFQQRPVWSVRAAVDLILKLATAMDAAHRQGVIHRDLKPSNILLPAPETPVIVGFGQSFRPASSGRTPNAVFIAPEQINGSNDQVGPRSDVYSLGVIFYQLLTGRLPAGNPDQLAPVLKFPADLDPKLKAMCTKAMAALPDGRYSSMREWVADLSAYRQTMSRQSDTDVRLPLGGSSLSRLSGSKLGREKLPPAGSPGTSGLMMPNSPTSSPTFSKIQELRQMSDSAIPGMPPVIKPRYARPNFLPWLVAAVMGGIALSVTLFLLTGGLNKDSQQNQQEQKPEQPTGVPLEKLKADLEDPNPEVRKVAAEKILEQREVGAVEELVARVHDPKWAADTDGMDKKKALLALQILAPDRVPVALQTAARTDNVKVRIWAIREIAQSGDRKMAKALANAVGDENPHVCIVAAELLRDLRWNDEDVINELVKKVSAEPWRGKPKDDGDDESDPKASGRDAALEALVQIDRKKTEETLTRLRHSGNTTLQQWANREFALRFSK